jgi:hypothetical protein
MEQMTVGMLVKLLVEACHKDPKVAYKKIIVADDTEGNGYHGMYYHPTTDTQSVKDNIAVSNGVYDTDTEDPNELIILG